MKKNTILVIAAVVIVIAGVVLLRKHSEKSALTAGKAQVLITEDGFSPSTLKVKRGYTVTWTNNDSDPHRVASYAQAGLSGFDSKTNIPNSGTYSYTFTRSGSFSYHDLTRPTDNATIIVE